MAVPEQIPVVNYVADGVVKKFDVPFEYDQQLDLHLYVDGVEPTIDKYFFADNAFNFYIAPTVGQYVKIKRITPKERDTDYDLHTNTVRPKALNSDFDRLWYAMQEVFTDISGLSQEVQDEIIARIQGDEDLLNQLTAEISARMLGDETVSEDLKNYIDNMIALIIGDPSFNGINADKVNDASGETQQQVNYNGGSKWHSRVGGYKENERVVLNNGDIVKSDINGNSNDPNTDMTGWVNSNSASQIIDKSGKTQQERNDYLVLSNEKPTLQEIIDTLDTSSNVIKRGDILFKANDETLVPTTINIEKFRLDLDGQNTVLKWTGNQTDSMIRIYDSSFTKVKNFSLVGDAANPPLAAILFDNDSSALKGTNEKCTVEDVIIGRKFLADTDSGGSVNIGTPYGRVQYGILVQPGGYGNNDEHIFRNVSVSDATVACFALKGDQHIWGSYENCLANAAPVGYDLGSNSTHYNSQSNRMTDVVYLGPRNTEHQIFGMYAEHPKMLIRSTAASFYVKGGKVLKNPTIKEPLIQFSSGGVLSLEGVKIDATTNPQFNYIDYSSGSVKLNGVYIKECTIANGGKRDFYKIHSATVGQLQTTIDIQHSNFIFQTEYPVSDETKTTQTAAANSSVVYSSSLVSQLVQGKYIHSAVGATIGATAQVPVCLDTSASRVRVMNRSGTALTIPDTQIRSMDLAGHILQNILSTATNMSFSARGAVKVNVPLFGVKIGDYIIPTTTNIGNTYVLYGVATADNQATIVVESISTSAASITGGIVGAAKFNENKARFHGITKTASLVAVAAKQSTSFTVNVVGVQIGSHCLVAPCADLGDLIATAHCNTDGVITVVVYNPSTASVDLGVDVFFKVCALF